jgi:hypothetical protein
MYIQVAKIKRLVVLGCLTASLLVLLNGNEVAATQEEVECSIYAEQVDQIPSEWLWNLASQSTIIANSGAVVSYWQLSNEYYMENNDQSLRAIIGAGLGDIGEKPVILALWSVGKLTLKEEISRSSDSASVYIKSTGECLRNRQNEPEAFTTRWHFKVSASGEVFINGERRFSVE